jgi:transposase
MPRRGRPPYAITLAEVQTVIDELSHHELAPRVRERLLMVAARGLGLDVPQIAARSRRSARTVNFWLRRFREEGIHALADGPRSGRPRRATEAYLAALDLAAQRSPQELGLNFDNWTCERLSDYLAGETGVRIAPSWVWVLWVKRHRNADSQQDFNRSALAEGSESAA